MKDYFVNVLIAIDQLFNTILGGTPDATMSAELYRLRDKNMLYYVGYKIVNFIFFWQDDHCYESYISEMERKHLNEEYR